MQKTACDQLFVEAFRHFCFVEDLAQRRLYQKLKAEAEKENPARAAEQIKKAHDSYKRVYGM